MRVTLVPLVVALAGCFGADPVTDPLDATDEDATTWFLQGRGTADLWMDTVPEGNNISLWHAVTPNQDPEWWSFPLRPAPDGLPLSGAWFDLAIDVQDVVGEPPLIETRLVVDGAVVARGGGPGGELQVPSGVVAHDALALEVCVCRDAGSLAYRYDLHLGGPSTLVPAPF